MTKCKPPMQPNLGNFCPKEIKKKKKKTMRKPKPFAKPKRYRYIGTRADDGDTNKKKHGTIARLTARCGLVVK